MISATECTDCDSIVTSTTAHGPLHSSSPAATKTIGPVTSIRSSRPEITDQPNRRTARAMSASVLTSDPLRRRRSS